ncbi:unnamed protein product [Durusdinium trenchii]|uniref:Myosin-3 n=2 Tax=Durusdinium trenchii TaxID=1381693 RepID=A0ABP0LQT3_9DINO
MAEQSMNYGGATALSQAKPNRPRFLVLPLVYCILVPWAVFAMVLWVRSFRLRFSHPEIAFTVEVVIWILALCLQFLALGRQARRLRGEAVDASWLNFVAASVLLWLAVATMLGEYNYKANMEPYYDIAALQTYVDIDPVNARGENLMDAGRMVFTKASYLDLKHSMGYMDSETWCVAPVVTRDLDQNSTQLVADFWAIGKNCCAGSKGGDFKCGSWSSHIAHGGLRLLNDAELSNYRLAVHQAASAFHIQVHHPIFLYWMPEPIEEVDAYSRSGHRLFHCAVQTTFWIQASLVFLAVFFISKLAQF